MSEMASKFNLSSTSYRSYPLSDIKPTPILYNANDKQLIFRLKKEPSKDIIIEGVSEEEHDTLMNQLAKIKPKRSKNPFDKFQEGQSGLKEFIKKTVANYDPDDERFA